MKVLMLRDIIKVGQRGDVVDVRDGFGRNYLIAKGLARLADKETMRHADKARAMQKAGEEAKKETFTDYRKKLANQSFTIKRKANHKGGLFGAVAAHDIIALLHTNGYRFINEDAIDGVPLKTTGDHTVFLRIEGGDAVPLHIRIESL